MAKSLSANQRIQKEYQERKQKEKETASGGKQKATWDPNKEMAKRREQSAAKKKQQQIAEERKNGTYKKGESQKDIIARSSKKGTSTTGTLTKEQKQGFRNMYNEARDFVDRLTSSDYINSSSDSINRIKRKAKTSAGTSRMEKLKNIGKSQPTKASGATKAEAESAAKSQSDQAKKRRTATVLNKTRSSKQNAPKKDTTSREYYKSKTTNAYEIAFWNKKKKSIWE